MSQNSQKFLRSDLSAWYPKAEAARVIGCSEKLIEQLARKRGKDKLQQAMYRRPGGGPRIAVYHPGDVERIAKERNENKPHVMAPPEASDPVDGFLDRIHPDVPLPLELAKDEPTPPPPLAVSLAVAFLRALYKISENSQKVTLPPSELRFVAYLSSREARAYSGLPVSTIRRLARDGKIAKIGRLYRRADLEAL
jgi:DNA-directed RNA polymerase specialized sigma24 family protein